MAAPLVVQLNIVAGTPHEEGPYTYAQKLPGDGEPAYLFLLLEAAGSNPEEICRRAAQTLAEDFAGSRLSVTGRLVEALKSVHEALLRDNRNSLPEHRTTLGAICVYLRSEDLYLAHAGPPLAYVIGPQGSRHLAPAPGAPAPGLGSLGEPLIWVRHHRLVAQETLLLTSSLLGQNGSERGVITAFQQHMEAGMVEVYRRARGNQTFAALAIDPGTGKGSRAAIPRTLLEASAAQDGILATPGATPYTYGRQDTPGAFPASPRPLPSMLGEGPPLSLSLSPNTPPRWVSRYTRSLLSPRLLMGLLVLFLLGGLSLAARAVAERLDQQTKEQAVLLVRAAEELQQQAEGASNRDARRQTLTEALEKLSAAQRQDPTNTDAVSLADRILKALNSLNAVRELKDLRMLIDFTAAVSSPVLIRDIAYQGNTLYVLDKGGDRVFQMSLSDPRGGGASPPLSVLSQPQGTARRNLTSLIGMPRGGTWPRDSLLALDDDRGLLELGPGGEPRSLPLRGAQEWTSFQAAAGYAGNLYILDPKGSQVWRYVPTDRGFDSERRAALPSVDLREAVDFFVDGDMYLLLRTGKVLKFSNTRPQPFSQEGLDKPLLNPAGIFAGPAARAVYVADAGNKRVVVFDKEEGKFLRQYPVPQLPQLQGLWVDEDKGVLLMVSDTRLYSATMPRE